MSLAVLSESLRAVLLCLHAGQDRVLINGEEVSSTAGAGNDRLCVSGLMFITVVYIFCGGILVKTGQKHHDSFQISFYGHMRILQRYMYFRPETFTMCLLTRVYNVLPQIELNSNVLPTSHTPPKFVSPYAYSPPPPCPASSNLIASRTIPVQHFPRFPYPKSHIFTQSMTPYYTSGDFFPRQGPLKLRRATVVGGPEVYLLEFLQLCPDNRGFRLPNSRCPSARRFAQFSRLRQMCWFYLRPCF